MLELYYRDVSTDKEMYTKLKLYYLDVLTDSGALLYGRVNRSDIYYIITKRNVTKEATINRLKEQFMSGNRELISYMTAMGEWEYV